MTNSEKPLLTSNARPLIQRLRARRDIPDHSANNGWRTVDPPMIELEAATKIEEQALEITQLRVDLKAAQAAWNAACNAHETCDVERLRLERNVLQIDLERAQRIAALHTADPFVVRHYTGDKRPCIKGNGFDGLLVGEDREEAQAFVDWLNDRLRQETKAPAQKADEGQS